MNMNVRCWFINGNAHSSPPPPPHSLPDSLVCMTQDPSDSLKDTSIADGGKIGSALTLGVNCSIGEGGRGPCCNRAGRQKARGGRKREKEKWKGGRREWRGMPWLRGPRDEQLWDMRRGREGKGVMEGAGEGGGRKREAIWQQHKCIKL